MRIEGIVPVDPKSLRVNIRFQSNRTLPPIVRKAMEDTKRVLEQDAIAQDWEVRPLDRYAMRLDIIMNDKRADLDGPIKRTIDAIADGLQINDQKIDELHVYRHVGNPGIGYAVWTLVDDEDVEEDPDGWFLIPGESFVYGVKP